MQAPRSIIGQMIMDSKDIDIIKLYTHPEQFTIIIEDEEYEFVIL